MDHVEIQIFTGQILFKKKERKKEREERERDTSREKREIRRYVTSREIESKT